MSVEFQVHASMQNIISSVEGFLGGLKEVNQRASKIEYRQIVEGLGDLGNIEIHSITDDLSKLAFFDTPEPELLEVSGDVIINSYLTPGVPTIVTGDQMFSSWYALQDAHSKYMEGKSLEREDPILRDAILKLEEIHEAKINQRQQYIKTTIQRLKNRGYIVEEEFPYWFPSSERARNKWYTAWSIFQELQEEYINQYLELHRDNPKVNEGDFEDTLLANMQWKVGQRTRRNIKKAGGLGFFDRLGYS